MVYLSLQKLSWSSLTVLFILSWKASAADRKIDFNREIRPILSNNCYQCHGPDEAERNGSHPEFRLDTRDGATLDLGGYFAILPGNPEASELIARVTSSDPESQMPPPSLGKKLTPDEIALLNEWIKQDAEYAPHWSYQKPVRPDLPKVAHQDWLKNPIDSFIAAKLEQVGKSPSPKADRYALARRVALDLTGLPPTQEDLDRFLNETDSGAYERYVDRLLSRPEFGEYWALQWLDLARYADSAGYADDPPRTIWLYRDYVIRSLNENKPFDQFTIEQLAGDLLPNPTPDQIIATAFHRNTLTNSEGGTDDEEFRNVAIVDRVGTTYSVWMGTTMACAQCHTHKFDPITHTDFFRSFAIFNNTADADRNDESPLYSVYLPEQEGLRTRIRSEIAQLETTLNEVTPELVAAQKEWEEGFPRELGWQVLEPIQIEATSGRTPHVDSGIVNFSQSAETDTYSLEFTLPAGNLQAIQLEALPEEKGGLGNRNFVLSGVQAELKRPEGKQVAGRFIRISIPEHEEYLALAEVEVLQGESNIALGKVATQSSTDFNGDAGRAVDGNTSGNFESDQSVTHTRKELGAWWEVDLGEEQPIDRIRVWNRTDGVAARLHDFDVEVLDAERNPVWSQRRSESPNPSAEFNINAPMLIAFRAAIADFSQDGFSADNVLKSDAGADVGWAVAPQVGKPHRLVLITNSPVDLKDDSWTLTLKLVQQSKFPNHVLERFRISYSDDQRVAQWAQTPVSVVNALNAPTPLRSEDQVNELREHFLKTTPLLEATRAQIATLQTQLTDVKPITVPVCEELPEGKRRETHIQLRGNFTALGDRVEPGTPEAFPPIPAGYSADRLGLAHWLVSEENPLTARVVVNRYWEQIFGVGIVSTSEDFGSQGELPSHPELLDWLATELIRLNWDTKAILRLIVTSATYQQSSRVTNELFEEDPENRLLARGPRFRISAETIRDQALALSGLLSRKMYGPPVKPQQPTSGLSAAFGQSVDWQTSTGDDKYRRGIYTTWRRSNPYPSMATFDAPNREVCTVRRVRTNTPLQALVTLNDPVYIEAAQALGRMVLANSDETTSSRISFLLKHVLNRPPEEAEIERLASLHDDLVEHYQNDPESAVSMATVPLGALPEGMTAQDAAVWTALSNVVLNLDEVLMKR
ncbi:DUF1553 domain-containing protein [Planctomicrobium sp. SH668]|uniref:DUF1553 domain-containing protein n=1 Tax=Planctomicrobium sp. SH668 TaxID=3448126 RepID=UPI003F5C2715